jgi:hypothetical protein
MITNRRTGVVTPSATEPSLAFFQPLRVKSTKRGWTTVNSGETRKTLVKMFRGGDPVWAISVEVVVDTSIVMLLARGADAEASGRPAVLGRFHYCMQWQWPISGWACDGSYALLEDLEQPGVELQRLDFRGDKKINDVLSTFVNRLPTISMALRLS